MQILTIFHSCIIFGQISKEEKLGAETIYVRNTHTHNMKINTEDMDLYVKCLDRSA